MKSPFTKSLISSGFIVAALALAGSGAIAADAQTRHSPAAVHVTHRHAAARVAARYRQPPFAGYNDLGPFIEGFFSGVLPPEYSRRLVSAGIRGSASRRGSNSGSYDWSPSPDYTSTAASSAATDAQAASDQEAQQMQQMNDENALNASTAAAEQQNEAANAATLQTEINAGF
jgi:hypothetical protein